jgi:hypothetical protein
MNADHTYYDFQHDDYADCHISNYIMGCQHHYSQQLYDHHPACSKLTSFTPKYTKLTNLRPHAT